MGKKGCTVSFLFLFTVSFQSFTSFIIRMLHVNHVFCILNLERFYCKDEFPAVVTAMCTKTCEFIVALIPVVTINRSERTLAVPVN